MPGWIAALLAFLSLLQSSPIGKKLMAAVLECVATQSGWQAIGTCILSKLTSHGLPADTPEAHAAEMLKVAIEKAP
jgi:hypothetical protein